jgi:hypothetical protein
MGVGKFPRLAQEIFGANLGEGFGPRLHRRANSPFGTAGAPEAWNNPGLGSVLGVSQDKGIYISQDPPSREKKGK